MSEMQNKVFYTKSFIDRPANGELKDTSMVVEGWFEKADIREVKTANGPKKVANVELTATIPDSRVKVNFGDAFVRNDHRVRFRAAFWGALADAVDKANYQKGTKLMVGIRGLSTQEWTGQDGTVFRHIDGNAFDFPQVTYYPAKGNNQQDQAPAYQQPQPAQVTTDQPPFEEPEDVSQMFDEQWENYA